MLDLNAEIRQGPRRKSSEDILHFRFVQDNVHPSIAREIINNDCQGTDAHDHLWEQRSLSGSARGGHIAQRAETMKQHDDRDASIFTKVRATVKRKTLLLLLVDCSEEHKEHAVLNPGKGCCQGELLREYKCPKVRILS